MTKDEQWAVKEVEVALTRMAAVFANDKALKEWALYRAADLKVQTTGK